LFQRTANIGNIDATLGTPPATNNDVLSGLKFNDKQMKKLFKKWFTFEEAHGTDANQEGVKEAAKAYVERSFK
jgi:hypothetical protein